MSRRYRRSRHLVVFWEEDRALLFNYATAMQAAVSTPVLSVIEYCSEWRAVNEVVDALPGNIPARQLRRLLDAMVARSFLCASGKRADPREQAMARWAPWNPSAGFFHTVSRQCVVGEQAPFNRRLEEKAAEQPMPAAIKPKARRRVGLPAVLLVSPIGPVVLARRTYRQFGRKGIRSAELSEMLRLASGVTHWLTVPGLGEVPLTGSPSAGARHPIETYVVVRDVEGLPSGTYRYAPDRHELDVISRGRRGAELRAFLPHQPWFAKCAAAVFFTAVFERTAWRYEYARAYRAVLLEAGHMCQTFLLAATALGLAPFCTMAMDDARLEKHLGIDGIREGVLYTAGVGTRPAVEARVVPPAGHATPRVRANPTP